MFGVIVEIQLIIIIISESLYMNPLYFYWIFLCYNPLFAQTNILIKRLWGTVAGILLIIFRNYNYF